MPNSNASVTPVNFELSPCRVIYNGVDIGGTNGNVKVKLNYTKSDLKADQYGDTVLDRRVSGFNSDIEFTLAEINDITKWKVAIPNSTLVGTIPNRSVAFLSKIGESDLSLAHSLTLHPLSKADADLTGDITFPLATAESVSEVDFGPKAQQGLKCKMHVYPNTSVNPAIFLTHGDPSNGLIIASAGTPSFSGTGNGILGAVAVFNTTKTETITAKCVGVPAANKSNWYVSGSLSGAIGELEITSGSPGASGSLSNPLGIISFTIADGSIDFVVGDAFTIATVGPNYV
jgi:hypothetical protein